MDSTTTEREMTTETTNFETLTHAAIRLHEAERPGVLAVGGSARSNFVAAQPPGIENRCQPPANPGVSVQKDTDYA